MNANNKSANQVKNMLDTTSAVLIDVREPAEHRAEKIPGSINIPASKFTIDNLADFKDKDIIVHCRTGNRSANAIRQLTDNHNYKLYNFDGGIEAWKAEGFKVKNSSSHVLPLDRQVQLTISLMVLIGLAIYLLITPLGLILPLFAGLGLLNAALTGWCGMAKLLAKMPWNQ